MSNRTSIYKTKNLTIRYLIALSLIALFSILSYTLLQAILYRQTSDATVINLSGRQRMLSQKLTKEVLLLVQSQTPELREKYRELIKTTLANWSKVHVGLQYGDKELKLPSNNSPEVREFFVKMEPYFQTINNGVENTLILEGNKFLQLSPLSVDIQNIVEASNSYLKWMDRTVFQYDMEARERVARLKQIETYILSAVLLLLFLAALFIFRPMVARVQGTYKNFQQVNEELRQAIKEQQKAEKQIKISLKEKEVLLKEIHHRVKNNLQIISSLLDLQSEHIKNEQTIEMFNETRNRIESMALIHEILYQSKDLARIDFAEYINNLIDSLFSSYTVGDKIIDVKVDIQKVQLNPSKAIPCGLIINELVSNSLKHAFPLSFHSTLSNHLTNKPFTRGIQEDSESAIWIKFYCENYDNQNLVVGNCNKPWEKTSDQSEDRFVLTVSDNGVGFPKDLDFRNTKSLGLQLVNTLTEQLDGTIELNRKSGTEFKIVFIPLENEELIQKKKVE